MCGIHGTQVSVSARFRPAIRRPGMTIASARTSGAGPKTVARMRQDEARIWEDLGSSGEALGVPVASARTSGAGPEAESGSGLGVVREWSGSASSSSLWGS